MNLKSSGSQGHGISRSWISGSWSSGPGTGAQGHVQELRAMYRSSGPCTSGPCTSGPGTYVRARYIRQGQVHTSGPGTYVKAVPGQVHQGSARSGPSRQCQDQSTWPGPVNRARTSQHGPVQSTWPSTVNMAQYTSPRPNTPVPGPNKPAPGYHRARHQARLGEGVPRVVQGGHAGTCGCANTDPLNGQST